MLSSEVSDAKTNMHLYTVWLKVGFMKCRYALHVSLRMINAKIGYRCRPGTSRQNVWIWHVCSYSKTVSRVKMFLLIMIREDICGSIQYSNGRKKPLLVCWFLPQNGSQKGSRLLKIYTHFEFVTNSNRLCRNKRMSVSGVSAKTFFSPNVLAVVFLQ